MRQLAIFLLFTACIACNNQEGSNTILDQPPYATISDSINRTPSDAHLYYNRGKLLFQNEQYALAEKDISRAWTLKPSEEYALSLATVYQQRSPDTAIAFLQKASELFPSSISLKVSLARGYQSTGQLQKALDIANEVLAAHPNQLDALILKYEILKATGKEKEAINVLQTAYTYAPFDPELVHNLAFEYALAGDAKVLALSDSLIKADVKQSHAEPYYFKGIYFNKKGDTKQALGMLDEAIRHDYYFIDAYMEKGEILFNMKKFPDAHKIFQLASNISPTYAQAYFWMGKTEEAEGKNKEAKLNYQRAYGLDKTLTEAKAAADRL
jgi:tetratricopeptide (TPR) repeat protein